MTKQLADLQGQLEFKAQESADLAALAESLVADLEARNGKPA